MLNPADSPDDAIRYLLGQFEELSVHMKEVAHFIQAYGDRVKPAVMRGPAISLQEHYNMLDEGDCGCLACSDWAKRREEFIAATALVPKGHKWSVCACDGCRFVGRFQLNLLAAANRRELLIEMSFHARYHSYHGNLVMAWTTKELAGPSYTDNWCAQEMNRFPMERWLQRCENAVSGIVGGKVFVNSTMRTDLYTPFNSSLTSDVDASHLV